jgi:hypothetical protein
MVAKAVAAVYVDVIKITQMAQGIVAVVLRQYARHQRITAYNSICTNAQQMGVFVAFVFFDELVFAVNAFWKCFNYNTGTGGKARHLTGAE